MQERGVCSMIFQRGNARFKVTARGRGSCKRLGILEKAFSQKSTRQDLFLTARTPLISVSESPHPNPQGSLGKQHSSLIDSMASLVEESAVHTHYQSPLAGSADETRPLLLWTTAFRTVAGHASPVV